MEKLLAHVMWVFISAASGVKGDGYLGALGGVVLGLLAASSTRRMEALAARMLGLAVCLTKSDCCSNTYTTPQRQKCN